MWNFFVCVLSALCPGCIHVLWGVKTRKRWHIHARAQILSPTLGQVDWFSWKTSLFQSHLVPPNLKTPLSQSHPVPPNMETLLSLSHPVPPNTDTPYPCPTCPTYSHLSQPVPFGCTTCPSPLFLKCFFLFLVVIPPFEKHWLEPELFTHTLVLRCSPSTSSRHPRQLMYLLIVRSHYCVIRFAYALRMRQQNLVLFACSGLYIELFKLVIEVIFH